jgi:hypothetical protein
MTLPLPDDQVAKVVRAVCVSDECDYPACGCDRYHGELQPAGVKATIRALADLGLLVTDDVRELQGLIEQTCQILATVPPDKVNEAWDHGLEVWQMQDAVKRYCAIRTVAVRKERGIINVIDARAAEIAKAGEGAST